MPPRFALSAALLLLAGLQAQVRSELTVQKIMADSKWIGVSPSRIQWAEDGTAIYFRWNPTGADEDSLFKYDIGQGKIVGVGEEETTWLPPRGGDYSQDRRWKTYAQYGDIMLLDIQSGVRTAVTRTQARESGPRFTGDEKGIVYRQGDALLVWWRDSGQTEQLIDFKSGEKPEEKTPKGYKGWLAREERNLIGVLAERLEDQAKEKQESEDRPPNIPAVYIAKSRVEDVRVSPGLDYITFRLANTPDDRGRTDVPSYITESGFTENLSARPKVGSSGTTYRLGIYDVAAGEERFLVLDDVPGIDDYQEFTGAEQAEKRRDRRKGKAKERREVFIRGPDWSDDGKQAVVELLARDHKDRWLLRLDPKTGNLTALVRDHDDAWYRGRFGGRGSWGWLPGNRQIWYMSEASGYNHLYTMDVSSAKSKQLTRGKFEVYQPVLNAEGTHFLFTANRDHPGIRHAYRIPATGGEMEQLTDLPGRVDAELSPDGTQLALRHSLGNRPWELYLQPATAGAEARRITHSQTEAFMAYPWRMPQFVVIPARDGARIQGRLYRPAEGQANGAGVVFVHGAGYLQNAHQWWSSYFREFMFHNLLTDLGYTVLDLDYRASAGYGRDWRTAIYRYMGGKDLDDNVDGAAWLVQEHGIDPRRIGLYGGSYGGFIAFMAMFTTPDVFAAAAALRPVTDWAHYNHGYTSNILNIPEADSVAYRRSSPIYHAEGLRGALLIAHGMIDTNVHFQDAVRLVQRLIELGKDNWELAVYPLEGHGFREPSSWTDEYKRVLKLFQDNLGPQPDK